MAKNRKRKQAIKQTKSLNQESVQMSFAEALVRSARPNFLVLTLSILVLTFTATHYVGVDIDLTKAVLIVIAALFAHLAVNWLNEYQDFTSGLDQTTIKTPFSGGSGALVALPQAANYVKKLAYASLLVVSLIGAVLVWMVGIELLLVGLLGLAIIVSYTKFITRQPWLCLIAPGLAFGPIMMAGSFYVLSSELNLLILVLSLVPFFLVNNLLLLNQIPDLEADKTVGRYNVLMVLGLENGIQLFAAFMWLAFITLGVAFWWFDLPDYAALGFLTLIIVFPMLRKLQLDYASTDNLPPVLAMNVIITLLTPPLIGVGLLL